MSKQFLFQILALCILGVVLYLPIASITPPASLPTQATHPIRACTAICLDNGNGCVFGANQDNSLEIGMLFINKRNVLKATWEPSSTGEYARWISRYGSVTINFVGYQLVWAGMNEAGLMLSTMSLAETQEPAPDERLPFPGPLWMQFQLDNHNTIEQVIASDTEIRLDNSAVDHYLVCDRTGACAVIEFLDGEMVAYTGENLPVIALTNSAYSNSIISFNESILGGGKVDNNSLWRFTTVAGRLAEFEPAGSDITVAYAFDTLKAVSREDTVWSFVFDPVNLRVHFRTNDNPNIRYADFSSLDFSCRTPVRMLNVHADVSGNFSNKFIDYTHAASFAHSKIFFTQYEGNTMSPLLVDTLLWGLESFPCQGDNISSQGDLVRYRPLLPQTGNWAGRMALHRVVPFWILLVGLSLAGLVWCMSSGYPSSTGQRLVWVLVTIILGPFGFLAYLLSRRKKHRIATAP
jgi:penicillin V acylase-like amidase (Ntn superfamily)